MPYSDPEQQRQAQAAWFQRNKIDRARRQRERRAELREWLVSLKTDQPCVDCGGTYHHAAMHWDHLPGCIKVADISQMVKTHPSKERIAAEIAKCELVCANCHAVRTFNRTIDILSLPLD